MCQACYDKGYKDYPRYDTSVAHIEDYKRGYKTRQNESLDADELQHTFFCEKCYERGLNNSKIGIWSPPLSTKRGHYESYEKGYNQVEMESANKIPEYHLPEEESTKTDTPQKVNWNGYFVAGMVVVLICIAGLVVFRFTHSPQSQSAADTSVASIPPPVVDTAAKSPATAAPIQQEQKQSPPPVQEEKPKPVPVQKEEAKKPEPAKQHEAEKPKPVKAEPIVKKTEQVKTQAPKDVASVNTGKALTEGDLKGLSKQELKFMRNEIFARHGYIFKTPELNNYFKQKPWYKPQHEDVNGMLSPEERQNVELIKKLER